MLLSVAVMMHPTRERYREYLKERLGDVPIVMDEGRGLWDTCRRAWLARPAESDFHLVVQDDALLCDGFMDRAGEWLDNDCATSFYFGRRDSYAEVVRAGLELGSVTLPRLHWGLAVCLPAHLIEPMIAFGDSLDIRQDDARVDRFLRSRGIPVRYPMPSLVDHRIGDSLVGDPGCNRKAFHFVDAPDVVYVCRKGDNPELRYSLRSLANVPHRRVWVFGGMPRWVTGVEHVPTPQNEGRYRNATGALRAACEHPDVSDSFILMNDDFYVMEPVDGIPTLNRGRVSDVAAECVAQYGGRVGSYAKGMTEIVEFLEARGYHQPLSFELHAPMLVEKATMREAIRICPRNGMHKRTVYGALRGLSGDTISDVKAYAFQPRPSISTWLSTDDRSFLAMRPLLQKAFPVQCRYESGVAPHRPRTVSPNARIVPGSHWRAGTTEWRDPGRTLAQSRHPQMKEEEMLYTSPTRVERRGFLIAYKGEQMTLEEAKRRDLTTEPKAAAPVAPVAEGLEALTVKGLKAYATENHIDIGSAKTKPDIIKAIEDAEAALEAERVAAEAAAAEDPEGSEDD